jgi:hypothetical protein
MYQFIKADQFRPLTKFWQVSSRCANQYEYNQPPKKSGYISIKKILYAVHQVRRLEKAREHMHNMLSYFIKKCSVNKARRE